MKENIKKVSSTEEPWFVTMPWPDDERGTFQEVVTASSKEDAIDKITKRMKTEHPSFTLSELRDESPIDCLPARELLASLLDQAYGINLTVDARAIEHVRHYAAAQLARTEACAKLRTPHKIVTEIGASEGLEWATLPTHVCVEIGRTTLQRWWSAYMNIRSTDPSAPRGYCVNLYWDAIDLTLLKVDEDGVEVERSADGEPLVAFDLDDSDARLEGPHIRIHADGGIQLVYTNKHGDGELWCDLANLESLGAAAPEPAEKTTLKVAA